MDERFPAKRGLALCLRIAAVALLVGAGGLEGRQDPPAEGFAKAQTDPETLQAVHEFLEAGKEAGLGRVRAAKEAAKVELRETSERDVRFELALREATARTPLRVTLYETMTLDNVRVTAYAAGQVTLTWPQGEVQYPLGLLPEETRAVLLAAALSKAPPRDHFEMGKLMVDAKDYERAARCFATAAQRDPALAPFVPDLDRVKKAARLFEGSFKAAGNTLGLRWTFSRPAEAGDFLALQGAFSIRPNQGLEVEGTKIALAAVKEIPFRDRVRVSAVARESDAAAHLLGIKFVKPDGGEVLIYGALLTSLKAFLVIRIEDEKSQEVLAPTPGAAGNRMTMEFNRGRFSFQVGEKTVWSGTEGGFTDVMVFMGGVSIPRPAPPPQPGMPPRAAPPTAPGKFVAQFKEASLTGEVNPRWMAKKTAGLRDALSSEMSKEFRAKRGEGAGGVVLSVEPAVTRAPEATRTSYQIAISKIAAMQKSQLQEDLVAAQAAVVRVTIDHPGFAPGWYCRGLVAETNGDLRDAEAHYRRALELIPEFPEALCGVARLQALAGKWAPAREGMERALALKPDLADGQLLRGRLQWEARDAAGTLEATQIARRLAPLDPEIQTESQMLANVARGPHWARTNSHSTAHYVVKSDLPAAKCKAYAEHLEAIRGYYEEVLNRPMPTTQPAEVVIFNTEEGYFTYNDFTVGSRQEHTLGAFSPWHGQMALFEGVEPADTLWVLSHEGFHQFLHTIAPDVPIWFNEGMAEYVGAAKVEKGKLVARGGILTGRLDNLKMAVKYGWKPIAFEHLMRESQAEFYGDLAPFKYAQAWSMIRYFMDGESGRWKGVLREYSDRLLAGDTAQAAFDATFAKQDLKAMEAGWLKFYGLVVTAKAPAAAKGTPGKPGFEPPEGGGALGVDVLSSLRPGATTGWVLKGGGIESTVAARLLDTGVALPEEYDVSVRVERISGEGDFYVGLRGGSQFFVLKMEFIGMIGLEMLDSNPGRNDTYRRTPRLFTFNEPRLYQISVRKTGIQVTSAGADVLEWKGNFNRLSLPPMLRAIAPGQNLFLGSTNMPVKISTLVYKKFTSEGAEAPGAKSAAPAATPPPGPKIAVDAERSIALNAEITRWVIDEDNGQIWAIEPAGNRLLQISIGERKILRKLTPGTEPTSLNPIPGNSKMVWVGNAGGPELVKIDLEKGSIVETVPVQFKPVSVVAVRKYLWCLDVGGGLHVIDLSDKKDLGLISHSRVVDVAYESRKDRIWAYSLEGAAEYEVAKIVVPLRERLRGNVEAIQVIEKATKIRPVACRVDPGSGRGMLLDDRNSKLHLAGGVYKTDKLEAQLQMLKVPEHSLESAPGVLEYLASRKYVKEIMAVSPDGKWVASGTHILSTTNPLLRQEIPLPTHLVAFSKDSTQLCHYDWVNKVISVMDVDSK